MRGVEREKGSESPRGLSAPRICSVDGCANKVKHAGLCSAHYQRLKNYGDAEYNPWIPAAVVREHFSHFTAREFARAMGEDVQSDGCRRWERWFNRLQELERVHFATVDEVCIRFGLHLSLFDGEYRRGA